MRENSTVTIHSAGKSDMESVRGILNLYIETSACLWSETLRNGRDIMRMYRLHQYSDRTPLMVAKIGREVVGFSALSFVSTHEGWREVAEDMVYLSPKYTGQGIGTQLLEAVMLRGHQTGLFAVIAKINAENTASLALHRFFGFEECGVLRDVGIKFGQRRSCVQMIYYYNRTAPDPVSILP